MAASNPRLYCPVPLAAGAQLPLAPGAARHVQVLRLQPGATVTLFNGEGGEFEARVERMGRSDVDVVVERHIAVEREASMQVVLAVGMPANERMDWLVEKATELGVAGIQPLVASRSVLRLASERAAKKQGHWQAIAIAACEQCGRNRVPQVDLPILFERWCETLQAPQRRLMLSLDASARPLHTVATPQEAHPLLLLSGPEGGLSEEEMACARARGFESVSLGPRVLRADTAPLAALAALTLNVPEGR